MQRGEDHEDRMRMPLLATCDCLEEAERLIVRTLKNRWPKCSCHRFMKVEKQWPKTPNK
jgi:hypothetical protein